MEITPADENTCVLEGSFWQSKGWLGVWKRDSYCDSVVTVFPNDLIRTRPKARAMGMKPKGGI